MQGASTLPVERLRSFLLRTFVATQFPRGHQRGADKILLLTATVALIVVHRTRAFDQYRFGFEPGRRQDWVRYKEIPAKLPDMAKETRQWRQ
jgi:hypothetical protein